MRLNRLDLNRVELTVTAVLSFLLFVCLLFAFALFIGQSKARTAEGSERELTAALARARKPFTAEVGFLRADALAKEWAPDAALALVETTIFDAAAFQADNSSWSYIFYSGGRNATALFVATPDRVDLVSTWPASGPVQTVGGATWEVDSSEAIAEFIARGGALFLNAHPGAMLSMTLTAASSTAWQGRLIDNDSGEIFHLNLDARTGMLLLEPSPQ